MVPPRAPLDVTLSPRPPFCASSALFVLCYCFVSLGVVALQLAKITQTFKDHFVRSLSRPRTIGREAEFPVVDADGRAADVRQLLERMDEAGDLRLKSQGDIGLFGDDFEASLEVGLGTVEVIVGPCDDLHQLRSVTERSVGRVVAAAESLGFSLLGLGCQPVTAPSEALLSPRKRYNRLMNAMGPDWLMFTVTASDQIHVDITELELCRIINVSNLLAPAMVALCGNSSVMGGRASPHGVASREGFWQTSKHKHRLGLPHGPFYSVYDYVTSLSHLPMLLRPRTQQEVWAGEELLQPGRGRFVDELAHLGFDWESWSVHSHYTWHAGRPRTRQRTVEIRPICQQPWDDHMVAAALSLGSVEAAHTIVRHPDLKPFMDWSGMRAMYPEVCKHGLDATSDQFDFLGCLKVYLDVVHSALEARGCGEEVYLAPLFDRLAARRNPGQEARLLLGASGVEAVVDAARLR